MANWQYFAFVLALNAVLSLTTLPVVEAARNGTDLGLIWLPAEAKQCTCSLTLSCNCCQSVVVDAMNMTRKACMTFKISILTSSVDIGVNLDNQSVAQFSISAKTPPTYCLPVLAVTPLGMCVKLHDVKLVGLTGIQVCSTFYTSIDSNQVFAYAFPCVKLSTSGVTMI